MHDVEGSGGEGFGGFFEEFLESGGGCGACLGGRGRGLGAERGQEEQGEGEGGRICSHGSASRMGAVDLWSESVLFFR